MQRDGDRRGPKTARAVLQIASASSKEPTTMYRTIVYLEVAYWLIAAAACGFLLGLAI